ncbi:DUF1611 domain-containing protein [Nitrosomonas sp. JL21]|uniref:DUF1611 domain-containing protein n=1 Tax=Nitrosomonas sp. JL21 TaxID=153949 RepID=UPI001F0410C3|nr:DUF1611 domain-containing protein [Nitrosomonas sp. JL21]
MRKGVLQTILMTKSNKNKIEEMNISSISQERLLNAKLGYTSRNLSIESVTTLLHGDGIIPGSGDIALARVTAIGQQHELELAHGRPSALSIGDEIIVCFGHSMNPFEFQVPEDLQSCHLVAPGGIAALVNVSLASAQTFTTIQLVGLLADGNQRCINLKDTALPRVVSLFPHPFTIAIVGSSMNTMKTTLDLICSLTQAGYRVGGGKVTGIGSGQNTWLLTDAGAKIALDFTHAGFPSTDQILPEQVNFILETLITHLSVARMDVIVLEISDDLVCQETTSVLDSKIFAKIVDGIVFTASDMMYALAGVELLKQHGLSATAIGGRFAESESASAETASAIGLPVLDKALLSPERVIDIFQIPVQIPCQESQCMGNALGKR